MYWSRNKFIGSLGIQDVMVCNRFQKLGQCFHVPDRQTEPTRGHPDYDRLFKVRPIIDHVAKTFLERYTLGPSMRQWSRIQASFRSNSGCPTNWSNVAWKYGCAAKRSPTAYLYRFDVYLGRRENGIQYSLGHHVVSQLTDNLYWFASADLLW